MTDADKYSDPGQIIVAAFDVPSQSFKVIGCGGGGRPVNLSGDVTGPSDANTVALVGGKTAAAVATAVTDVEQAGAYIPTAYTPLTQTVLGQFQGINAAFAALNALVDLKFATVYVDKNAGVDSPERGTVLRPYATPDYAMSQITDSGPGKPYLILTRGSFSITDLKFKNFVFLDGQGATSISVTNQVTLDPSYVSGPVGFRNVTVNFPGGLNFDFSAAGASSLFIQNISNSSDDAWNIIGQTNNTTTIIIEQVTPITTPLSLFTTNVMGSVFRNKFQSLTFEVTSSTISYDLDASNNKILGDYLLHANGAGTVLNTFSDSNYIFGAYTAKGTAAGVVNLISENCTVLNSLVIDGVGPLVNTGVISVAPTFIGGATSAQLAYSDKATSMTVTYSPSNYTPTTPQVQGHLIGIDIALDNTENLQTTRVYVCTAGGVNAPGRGSVNRPYATPDYAMSQITDSNVKPYTIVCTGNFSISDLEIKQNVSLLGNFSILVVTNQITLDPGFTVGRVGISDFSYLQVNNGITFNLTPGCEVYLKNLRIDGAATPNLSISGASNVIIDGVFGVTDPPILSIENVSNVVLKNSFLSGLSLINNGISFFSATLKSLSVFGPFAVTATSPVSPTRFLIVNGDGVYVEGNTTLTGPTNTDVVLSTKLSSYTNVDIVGPDILFFNMGRFDSYTLAGGATFNQLKLVGYRQLIVGTAPTTYECAALSIDSTTQGFLFPRMTTAERDLITNKVAGLAIFNITTSQGEMWDGTTWVIWG